MRRPSVILLVASAIALPAALPAPCRAADHFLHPAPPWKVAVADPGPTPPECSSDEKQAVLLSYAEMIQAAAAGDIYQIFALTEGLEESLSESCWVAINRSKDPDVRNACTAAEIDLVASAAGPLLRALERVLTTGDPSDTLEVTVALTSRLSPDCWSAFGRAQQQQQPPTSRQYRPPNVLDHGGGTFSVPGVGTCSSSGCMAY